MPLTSRTNPRRRGRLTVVSGSSPGAGIAPGTVPEVIPVFGPQMESLGSVVYRHRRLDGDMWLEVRYRGIVGLVPCRRASDVVKPDCVYVLDDGRLWFASGQAAAPTAVVAELTGSIEG